MAKSLAFVTYETTHAPCGGIAAVMQHLPDAMRRQSGLPTCLITPFHHRIRKTVDLDLSPAGKCEVRGPKQPSGSWTFFR